MHEKVKERMRQTHAWLKEYVPRPAAWIFWIALASAILLGIACLSSGAADLIDRTIGAPLRTVLASLTNWLPFSLAETVVYLLPLVLVLFVWMGVRRARNTQAFRRFLFSALAVVLVLCILFVFTLGCAYHGSTLDSKLGLARQPVSATALYQTALWLQAESERLCPEFSQEYQGSTIMPLDWDEMNAALLEAYDTVADTYPFLQRMESRVKRVTASSFLSQLHLTGIYTYMTGEANINTTPPDYCLPFTAAHEMAHQRGIARENEANFVAFLVCISSENAYLRYCGYTNMLQYVMNALYTADKEAYQTLAKSYSTSLAWEMHAYALYYAEYADSRIGEVSHAVNNAYLQLQGTAGTASYGMVVDLAVAYHASIYADTPAT